MRTRAGLNSSMRSVNVHTPHPPNTPGFGNGSVGGRSTNTPLHAHGDGRASTAGSTSGSAEPTRTPPGTPGDGAGSAKPKTTSVVKLALMGPDHWLKFCAHVFSAGASLPTAMNQVLSGDDGGGGGMMDG